MGRVVALLGKVFVNGRGREGDQGKVFINAAGNGKPSTGENERRVESLNYSQLSQDLRPNSEFAVASRFRPLPPTDTVNLSLNIEPRPFSHQTLPSRLQLTSSPSTVIIQTDTSPPRPPRITQAASCQLSALFLFPCPCRRLQVSQEQDAMQAFGLATRSGLSPSMPIVTRPAACPTTSAVLSVMVEPREGRHIGQYEMGAGRENCPSWPLSAT